MLDDGAKFMFSFSGIGSSSDSEVSVDNSSRDSYMVQVKRTGLCFRFNLPFGLISV